MNPKDKLSELFGQFPGIGARQAKRFVYFLLSRDAGFMNTILKELSELKESMRVCTDCFRFFTKDARNGDICPICKDKTRDDSMLMIVARDADFETIEKSGTYRGKYFVLGGTVPILEKNPSQKVRIRELKGKLSASAKKIGLKEIILGMSLNPEGENTAMFLRGELKSIAEKDGIKFSHLGRGLSTGTELEYSDSETLKNALENRR